MLDSDFPSRFKIPFANGAGGSYVRAIPDTSADPVAASLQLGFPPDTFTPLTGGGTPPDGKDFNGILKQLTQWARWQAAGGPNFYDSTFSTAVGGYPSGAALGSVVTPGLFWVSTANNNTTDPDGGSPANWEPLVPFADDATTQAGVSTTTLVTPAGLFSFPKIIAADSHAYVIPGTDILVQAGRFTSLTTTVTGAEFFTFPTPFAALASPYVQLTPHSTSGTTNNTAPHPPNGTYSVHHSALNYSAPPAYNGFSFWVSAEDEATDVFDGRITTFDWRAEGPAP